MQAAASHTLLIISMRGVQSIVGHPSPPAQTLCARCCSLTVRDRIIKHADCAVCVQEQKRAQIQREREDKEIERAQRIRQVEKVGGMPYVFVQSCSHVRFM